MRQIAKRETLAKKYDVHTLRGKYNGYLACHLEPDFLLVWQVKESELVFVRTGNHSELFGP
jgi:mRNA interferase YafQ